MEKFVKHAIMAKYTYFKFYIHETSNMAKLYK